MNALNILHLTTTFMMTGIIWIVQMVHYPAFHFIDKNDYLNFQLFHMRRISFIVMPLMSFELISIILISIKDSSFSNFLLLGLTILIWLITFLLNVPLHNKLLNHHESLIISKLIQSNWPRTLCWSLKSVILTYFLLKYP